MFKTLEDAVAQMEAKFSPAGRDVAAWPVEPGASEHELEDVEQRLGLKLPDSFRSVVARYDFLNAVAGNVSMTYAETFADWLADPNVEPVPSSMLKWWGSRARPVNLLLIAQSDAHTILLNTDMGEVAVLSVDRPGDPPDVVATSFALFYQGLSSVYLEKIGSPSAEAEAATVASAVGAWPSSSFWTEFAVGAV